MPAEDRARKPGALPSAPDETGVSMRALLASCAAADAVSTPPSDADEQAQRAEHSEHSSEHSEPDGEDEAPPATAGPLGHPGRNAA